MLSRGRSDAASVVCDAAMPAPNRRAGAAALSKLDRARSALPFGSGTLSVKAEIWVYDEGAFAYNRGPRRGGIKH